jgi:hypothetical protein
MPDSSLWYLQKNATSPAAGNVTFTDAFAPAERSEMRIYSVSERWCRLLPAFASSIGTV